MPGQGTCLDGTTPDIASFNLHPKAKKSSELCGVREAERLSHQDQPVSLSREMLCHVLHHSYSKQLCLPLTVSEFHLSLRRLPPGSPLRGVLEVLL